jgi:PEP-CTERM motif
MNFKLSAIGAALLAATALSAQANMTLPATGSSSVVFVAMDGANNLTNPSVSLTLNLGYSMLDFMPAISGWTQAAGSLTAAGTTVVWDFVNNTRTTNGVLDTGTFAYNTPFASYNAAVVNGSEWGVIAADNLSGASSATTAANFNTMGTGNSTAAQMAAITSSGSPGQAAANAANYFAANNNKGTHAPGVNGGHVATGGTEFLDSTLGNSFGAGSAYAQNIPYLTTGSQNFIQFTRQQANTIVYQLGLVTGIDTPSANPATFTFDATAGTLTYAMPVPEPGQYAMLLAGLAAIGFVVRRRQSQR